MSWKDKIENGIFKITTGDGKVFKPLYKTGKSSKEYNTTTYNFIGREGTLVDRKKPQSGKYPLSFYFQGEDHVEETERFLNAADDPRAWEIQHPLYGLINGQPLNIEKNDTSLGITEITVEFWESITVDFPEDRISVKDRIEAKAIDVKGAGIKSFLSFTPETANINTMKLAAGKTRGSFVDMASEQKVAFENGYNAALKATDKLISSPRAAIQKQQDLVSIPATFNAPVKRKLKAFKNVVDELVAVISSKNDKYYYESQASAAIASACECAVNPTEEDYVTRTQIENAVTLIAETYNNYLAVLDQNKVGFYEVEKTWNADAILQQELQALITDTVANLQVLAFEAKQERTVYTEKDTNLILLTHRYVGLDANDENLERFRQINNIKNEEVFLVRKGRQIKYFA